MSDTATPKTGDGYHPTSDHNSANPPTYHPNTTAGQQSGGPPPTAEATPGSGQGAQPGYYPQYGAPPQQFYPPPGQNQYPYYYSPQGQYYPPNPQAQYGHPSQGQYPPLPGQYPPAGGQFPPPAGQYSPPGQYPPPPGQFPPPPLQGYPNAPGQYPPPQGQQTQGQSAQGQTPQGQSPQGQVQGQPPQVQGQQPQVTPGQTLQGQPPQPPRGTSPQPNQGQYPQSTPGQYPQGALGQYPQGAPGQYPQSTPGQYAPPFGQYPPPPGQYPPYGQFPAAPGQYPPPGQYLPPPNQTGAPGTSTALPPPPFPNQPPITYPGAATTVPGVGAFPIPQPGQPTKAGDSTFPTPQPDKTGTLFPVPGASSSTATTSGGPFKTQAKPTYTGPPVYLGSVVSDPHKPLAGYDPKADFDNVRKATKGFGTNDALLTTTLVGLSVPKMEVMAKYFLSKTGKTLIEVIESETSSWFKMGLRALALGPLEFDVELANTALSGVGTNETLLTELILGRPYHELQLLSHAYTRRYHRSLLDDIKKDLSGKTERMFAMALGTERPPDLPIINHEQVARDVAALYQAAQGKVGTDELGFCSVIFNCSQNHLSAVIGAYGQKYRSLTKVIKSEFSGHMKAGLLHIVSGAKPKRGGDGVWRDAKLIEQAMAGFGTREMDLVWRIIRGQWDQKRFQEIKRNYSTRYKQTLENRVNNEISGSFKKLMLATINSRPVN